MNIERNLEGFPYIDENGKARKYYPDFLVNGKYVEIKGFMRKRDQYKFDRFPYPIEIIDSIKIKPMIIEMKRHFGVSEIKILLEPEKLITKICKYCNTEFIRHKNKNFYCSRSCSGKAVSNKKWHSLSDLN